MEFIVGILGNLISDLISSSSNFIFQDITDNITWKKWKAEHHLSKSQNDFLDRYAETLVMLKSIGKPRELLRFYGQESVINIIYNYWYGTIKSNSFENDFIALTQWFTLEKQLNDFSAEKEIAFFFKSFGTSVNQNRTAGQTEIYQKIIEIWNEVKKSHDASFPKNLIRIPAIDLGKELSSHEQVVEVRNGQGVQVFQFVNYKQEKDYDIEKKAQKGVVLHSIPRKMQLKNIHRCIIRVAYEVETILKDLPTYAKDVVIKEDTKVTERMEVVFEESEYFDIKPINTPKQIIGPNEFTEWNFDVTPLQLGRFPLTLKISCFLPNGMKEIVLTEFVIVITEPVEASMVFVVSDLKTVQEQQEYSDRVNSEISENSERLQEIMNRIVELLSVEKSVILSDLSLEQIYLDTLLIYAEHNRLEVNALFTRIDALKGNSDDLERVNNLLEEQLDRYFSHLPAESEIVQKWQETKSKLEHTPNVKWKLKSKIPFVFQQLEKELSVDAKAIIKEIRREISAFRKGDKTLKQLFIEEDSI